MVPFIGFAPDLDPTTPGVITDCTNIIPTLKGVKGGYSLVTTSDALAAACRGAAVGIKTDNSRRTFAGTQTKIYELSGSSWSDVSRVGDYTGSTESRWRFTTYGNNFYAVNGVDTSQKATTGDFADCAEMPKASLIETIDNFVMIADYNDGTEYRDGWGCSALGDPDEWTASVATQCVYGRLTGVAGPIRALKRLGSNMVIYKDRGMWIGTYQGPPVVWSWTNIPVEIGTSSQEGVVSIGVAHFFPGYEDFYMFDGTRPIPLECPLREWFFGRLDASYRYKISGLHDRANSLIYWFYPLAGSGGTIDSGIVYNYKSNKWGRADRTIEAVVEYLQGSLTYAQYEAAYATYDVVPELPYGSAFWTSATPSPAVFNGSHVLGTLTGASTSSSLTTGDYGTENEYTLLNRATLRYLDRPDSATMTNYYQEYHGGAWTEDMTVTESSGRFDVLRSAPWHKAKFDFTGDVEVSAASANVQPDGVL